jgi:hypothetical protein
MTPEDRDAIVGFFDRLRNLQGERDPEAERLIHELMERHPQTKYYVTQMAFFLEHAQAEAQNRIRELEHLLEQQRAGGGLFGGLFGGGRTAPPPTPTHAPGYRPGMFQQPGGFLGGAPGTVTALAGGFLLGSLLGSLLAPPADAAVPPAEQPDGSEEDGFGVDVGDESW